MSPLSGPSYDHLLFAETLIEFPVSKIFVKVILACVCLIYLIFGFKFSLPFINYCKIECIQYLNINAYFSILQPSDPRLTAKKSEAPRLLVA